MKPKLSYTQAMISLVVVVVLCGAAYAWAAKHQPASTTKPVASKQTVSKGSKAPAAATKTSPAAVQPTATTPAVSVESNPSHPSSSTLAAPTGSVLNVSSVSLTAGPSMDSTCQTVFGASCGLQLTSSNGGTMKTVTPQAVNGQGAVDLRWTASSVGLTPGTWEVQLLATKDGQTTLGAAYPLKVSQ